MIAEKTVRVRALAVFLDRSNLMKIGLLFLWRNVSYSRIITVRVILH